MDDALKATIEDFLDKKQNPGKMWGFQKRIIAESITDEEFESAKTMEPKWKEDNKWHKDDEGVLKAFPDIEESIPEKLNELWDKAGKLFLKMKEIRVIVDKTHNEPFEKWFFTHYSLYEEGIKLKDIYQQIKRLRDYRLYFEKKHATELLRFAPMKEKERSSYNIDKMFKRENLLVDIALANGVDLRHRGFVYVGLCPFHQEDTPSFTIYQDNWFHCFGCQKHGSFLDFLMWKKNIDFKDALREADYFC